jgi:sterol 14-demethylase
MEMKALVAILLQNFDMELMDEVKPVSGATTYWPAQPCRVRYKRRKVEGPAVDGAALAKAAGCPAHV